MTHHPNHPDGWTWQRPIGLLHCGPLTGRVDVSRPQLGLHQLRLQGDALDGHVLGVAWEGLSGDRPADVTDCYMRASDLVAAYRPQAGCPFAPQVYWRAEPTGSTGTAWAALTIWVSVQTDLLNTHPIVHVESQLPADELLHVRVSPEADVSAELIIGRGQWQDADRVGPGCLMWRLPGGRVSCAQFARAGDVQELQAQRVRPPVPQSEGISPGRWRLSTDFLEKGVIRRACLQLVVLWRQNDVAQAAACCRAFQSQPLPLAT